MFKNSKNKIQFCIEKKIINKESPTFIIAEIGINHEGNFKLAKNLVDKAFKSGADAVKFQIVNPDHSYSKNTLSYKVFKDTALSAKNYKEIINEYKHRGLVFATPGDIGSLELCKQLDLKLYKVSSGLLTNIPLIEQIIKTRRPIILSSGMTSDKELSKIIKIIQNKKRNNLSILHSVSLYPTPILKTNLQSIKYIENEYNVISGYSDHCIGWEACKIAVAMGAKIIEKHFTLDSQRKGFDHSISLNPKDFKKMVQDIRQIEKIIGNYKKVPVLEELKVKTNIIRYCVASKDISKGEKINLNNVFFKRIKIIKKGIKAYDFNLIKEKKSKFNIKKGNLIVY